MSKKRLLTLVYPRFYIEQVEGNPNTTVWVTSSGFKPSLIAKFWIPSKTFSVKAIINRLKSDYGYVVENDLYILISKSYEEYV